MPHGPSFFFGISVTCKGRSQAAAGGWVASMERKPWRALLPGAANTGVAISSGRAGTGTALACQYSPRVGGTEMPSAPPTPGDTVGHPLSCAMEVAAGVEALPPSSVGDLLPGLPSRRDKHRAWLPGSPLDLEYRPLGVVWTRVAETLTWAERDRPWSRSGTPSLLWPSSGRERSAPVWIRLGVGRVDRILVRCSGLELAWMPPKALDMTCPELLALTPGLWRALPEARNLDIPLGEMRRIRDDRR